MQLDIFSTQKGYTIQDIRVAVQQEQLNWKAPELKQKQITRYLEICDTIDNSASLVTAQWVILSKEI